MEGVRVCVCGGCEGVCEGVCEECERSVRSVCGG